jgi:hypothetical protein
MKKILTLAAVLAAAIAQAGSFQWGTGTVKVSFDGTTFSSTGYDVTGYLVYLGTSTDTTSLWTLDTSAGTIAGATSVDTKAPTTSGLAANKGKIVNTYNDGDNGNVSVGNTFGMYIQYTDAAGVKWFNFSETVAVMSTDATGAYEAKSFAFDFSNKTEINVKSGAKPTAGGGWYAAVPEPSVALMGLLGIGMLIRRRKA